MPLIESAVNLVSTLIGPILELIAPLLDLVFNIIDPLIYFIEPIIDVLVVIIDLISMLLLPILEVLTPVLQMLSDVFEILGPPIRIVADMLKAVVAVIKLVVGVLETIFMPVLDIVIKVIEAVCNVVSGFGLVFTQVFEGIAWVCDWLVDKIRNPFNAVLGFLESVANGVIRAVNTIIKAMNELSFTIPDYVPGIGGKTFGFNLKEVSEIKIPRLAQGAVIPPNKEFLAMLGDQTHGTNIEAPLDTIKQALAEVLAEVGGGTREPIVLQVSGRTLAKVVWDEQEKRYKQTGHY
jgi:hypothetical protein